MVYYHGSAARLNVGDVLVPGDEIGVSYYNRSAHVYMTHPYFSLSETEYVPAGVRTAEQYALREALSWSCWAADISCDEDCAWLPDGHSESIGTMVPDCVRVYKVQPDQPVEFDDANDTGPESCRAARATVLHALTDSEIAKILEWS